MEAEVAWPSLPVELLIKISSGFESFSNFYAFRAVCRSWRAATLQIPDTLSFPSPIVAAVDCFDDEIFLYDPARDVYLHVALDCGFRHFSVVTSSHGFLVITGCNGQAKKIVLFNIVTGVKLHLPHLDLHLAYPHKVVLSASPLSPDCTVAFFTHSSYLPRCHRDVFFCCVGDTSWRRIPALQKLELADIVFAHGVLYALSNSHRDYCHQFMLTSADLSSGTTQNWPLNISVHSADRIYLAVAQEDLLLLHFKPRTRVFISSWDITTGRFLQLNFPLDVAVFCGNWSFVKSVLPTAAPIPDTYTGRRLNYRSIKPNYLYVCRTFTSWWEYPMTDVKGQIRNPDSSKI